MESGEQIKQGSIGAIVLGILMSILGIVAIASPVFAGLAAELLLGWLFIAGSIIQAVEAFQHYRPGGSLVLKWLLALLYLVVGILLLVNPWMGAISLTLFIGIFFFVDGVFRVILAFQLKPSPRWGWVLLNGLLMIVLGILIWSQWPTNAPWILGFLVGIGLLVNGLAILLYGSAVYSSKRGHRID